VAVSDGDQVLVGAMGGHIYSFDLSTGAHRWTYDGDGIVNLSAPVVLAGRAYLLPGGASGRLHAVELASGQAVPGWPIALPVPADVGDDVASKRLGRSYAVSSLTAAAGMLMLDLRVDDSVDTDHDGVADTFVLHETVLAVNPGTGQVAWQTANGQRVGRTSDDIPKNWLCPTPAAYSSLRGGSQLLVVASTLQPTVQILDARNGHRRGAVLTVAGPTRTAPILANGRLFLESDDGSLEGRLSSSNQPPDVPVWIGGAGRLLGSGSRPTLEWKATLDPEGDDVSYELRLDRDGEILENWQSSEMTAAGATTLRLATTLEAGVTYVAALRARDVHGAWSDWSKLQYLRSIGPQVPRLAPPASPHFDVASAVGNALAGNLIRLPAGIMHLTQPLSVPPGVALEGAGPGRTVLDASGLPIGVSIDGNAAGRPTELRSLTVSGARIGIAVSRDVRDARLRNVIVRDNTDVGLDVAVNAAATLINGTLVGNGRAVHAVGRLLVKNSLVTGNQIGLCAEAGGLIGSGFNDVSGNLVAPYEGTPAGASDLASGVVFASYAERDLHVRPGQPTTDSGDPADDFSLEPSPNGGRINLGAYGGTAEAEASVGAMVVAAVDGGLPDPLADGGAEACGDGSGGAIPASTIPTPARSGTPSRGTTPVVYAPGGEVKVGEGCSVGDGGQRPIPSRDRHARELLVGLGVLLLAGRRRRPAATLLAQRALGERTATRGIGGETAWLERSLPSRGTARALAFPMLALVIVLFAVGTRHAEAATYYWIGGTTGTVGQTTRWSTTSAGTAAGAVPGSSDAAVFDGGGIGNCSINANSSFASVSISSGYTGTVSLTASTTLTTTGSFNQAAGIFTGSTGTITAGGDLTLSGGTFTAPSGLLEVKGAFNRTGGTFTHNSGRVVVSAGSAKTLASNGATFNDLSINDGLIGYWKLDETVVGTAADSSGYGNTGTHTGTPSLSASVPSSLTFSDGRSVSLNGTSQYVSLGNPSTLNFAGQITIAAWVFNTNSTGTTDIVAHGYTTSPSAEVYLRIVDGRYDCGCWNGTGSYLANFTPSVSDVNSWVQLTCTYDGAAWNLYRNGTLVNSSTTANGSMTVTDNWAIGARGAGDQRFFSGNIDDVRIYNRALTATEAAAIGGGGLPGTTLGTQTLTGNPIIAGDLTIASGTLAGGNTTITVAGSWWNTGGVFTTGATGTVTFNGSSSGKSILAAGSAFNGVTISGTGAWTLADTGTVSLGKDFAQSAGTFTSTPGTLRVAGAFNETGGTFTHNGGRVQLTSTSSQTLATNGVTFNHLTINDGLVGYFKLDEGAGTSTVDSSGYANDGTLLNGPSWVTGASNLPTLSYSNAAGVSFDGVNDYVGLGTSNLPAANAAQSIAVWVKATATASTQDFVALLGASSAVQVGIRQISSVWSIVAWKNGGTTLVSTAAGSFAGSWHHVAYTFDGTTHSLYIDGGTPVTSTIAAQTAAVTQALLGSAAASLEPFAGTLDEVRIYKRALSATEISALAAGNPPGTSVATQTLTGNPTISGNLVIASGTLSAGTSSLTVGASFSNYGGLFSASSSGLVTFNGSGSSNVIRSAGQVFGGITLNGSGTWTIEDRLEAKVGSVVTLTAGTLSTSSYTLRAGSLTRTTGTLSTGTGRVVLDGNANATIGPGAFNDLRVEPVAATALVGYWKLDAGQGLVARDFSSGGHDASLTNGPLWTASNLPSSITFDNPAALTFDGVDDYVDAGASATPSNAAFSVCAWVKLNSTSGWQALVSQDGTNTSAYTLVKSGVTNRFALIGETPDANGAGVTSTDGTTTPVTGTWYHLCGTSDATALRLYVNGVMEGAIAFTPSWLAAGHTILGAGKYSGARSDYLKGVLDDVRIYSVALTAAQVAALAAGRYPDGLGGAATYTLGANTTVAGTFALDAGALATSSYTFNASSSTTVATVNSGTYTVGSAASTFAGGLTVSGQGTVDLSSSGGAVKIGSTKTLTIDGTLSASSTGATIQTAGAAGTYYTFKVGTTATATPTLNITGLAVKNTDTSGMYVNAVSGSTTTFTRFDNIAFSGGAGAHLLQIYAPTLYLVANGCSFDAGAASGTTTSNVTLRGDGSATETRAIFGGATCLTGTNPTYTLCEANDDDDDANNDGIGENAATNGAVIQWTQAAMADTSGTLEGFPTAALDWNTFTYYSTYVLFHDVAGGTADRIYVRSTNGAARYSWDSPSGVDLVGPPRFDTIGGVHYVYTATSSGKVYRLIDNGSTSLTQDSSGNWASGPFDCGCTITTPLGIDANNLYFGGTTGGNNKIWTLGKTSHALAPSSPLSVTAVISGVAPAIWSSGDTYAFMGSAAHLYKVDATTQTLTTDNATLTGAVSGRLSIVNSKVYAADTAGTLLVADPNSFATTLWSYHDNSNHAGCVAGSNCAIGSMYVDPVLNRAFYGDGDGHLYASYNTSGTTGAELTGYPYRPGSSNDVFSSPPFYNAGILVAGTTTGNLYVIDLNAGSGPVLKQSYAFGATTKISGISYDRGSAAYMVATADASAKDGKLYYIDALTDPTPASN
jgi:hypothetical protein